MTPLEGKEAILSDMVSGLGAISLELGLLAVALLVLVADLLLGAEEKRGLGPLAAVGVGAVLLASFFLPGLADGGFTGAYVADATGLYFKRVLLLAGFIAVLGSVDHVDRFFPSRQGEHYLLLLFSLTGMLLLTGAQDALVWIVAFELAGMPLYVLAAMHKTGRGTEAGLKIYLTGAASTAFTLYGFTLIWGMAGDTSFATLSQVPPQPLFALGVVMVLAGVAFKIGAVPFHLWMADTYQGAPAPTVAFLSVAPKVAVFAGLIRLLVEGLLPMGAIWRSALIALAIVTLVQGNFSALPQRDTRRLLALSGVGHMGLLLVALAAATPESLGTLAFYCLAYVVSNMGAFLVLGVMTDNGGTGSLGDLKGLATRSPGLAACMLVFLLSLGGIPFVAGFWAKVLLFWAAWKAGLSFLVVLGALLTVLALFYYLKVARAIYIEEAQDQTPITMAPATVAALALCTLAVVGIGVLPGWFIQPAMDATVLLFP
jgi:NADH-quinone oxidoreductase subunit N